MKELSIDRKEIQEKMDWIINKFVMDPQIKKWAEDVDIQLRITGVEDELSVSSLIYLIDRLSRALWGMCHYEENWEDYANCKTDSPYHIAKRMKDAIEERHEHLKEREHFKNWWSLTSFDEEKVRWLMDRNEGECNIRDALDIYYEFRENPYAAIRFLNTCTEAELSKIKKAIEMLINWYGDPDGENEFIASLESIGRLKSDEIFEMVKKFKNQNQP
ncbi:hypothetical protein [Thermoactinomyces sp. CICC 10522]|uniref:hypothetical protein n=1 Tax=Thermoactinomyces sp. CICC 10522 TaxID=2767427 RepID=UPI0018DC244F|nr:hypothetical protein [Thermoactinomyces sp. CICC 10522]MBH8605591.1 hypothetical protein [Thermoactinomyces sp. CICC 10522]